MKTIKILLIICCIFLIQNITKAQTIDSLVSDIYHIDKKNIPFIKMPYFDVQKEKQDNPLKYGKVFLTDISPTNSGIWQTLDSGKIWHIGIYSKDAFSLGIIIKNFNIPKGAVLNIYNTTKQKIVETFDYNYTLEILPIYKIAGDSIIIEYYQPNNSEFESEFTIYKIVHAYINSSKHAQQPPNPSSINSRVGINCPAGDNWQDEKHSVVWIESNGYEGTGYLINNTNYDRTPYVLTAHHVIPNETIASETIFYFNYESETCSGTTGSKDQFRRSAWLKSTGGHLVHDYSLLELKQTIPLGYEPYYAGWNRSNVLPQEITTNKN